MLIMKGKEEILNQLEEHLKLKNYFKETIKSYLTHAKNI